MGVLSDVRVMRHFISGRCPSSRALGCCCARRAGAKHVDDMMRLAESVASCNVVRPLLNRVCFYLYRHAALTADEVVMVAARSARTVHILAFLLQRVGFAIAGEIGERPIYRRKPNR
jgi:hypothetical protein